MYLIKELWDKCSAAGESDCSRTHPKQTESSGSTQVNIAFYPSEVGGLQLRLPIS